jgi:hypothetical protein
VPVEKEERRPCKKINKLIMKEKDKKTRTAIFFHNLIWSFIFCGRLLSSLFKTWTSLVVAHRMVLS